MPNYLAYELFIPQEISVTENCIWCGLPVEKNQAHVLSRRIIRNDSKYNVLKKTICVNCNSKIGANIEDFLFRKTPLAYLADIFLRRELKSLKWVPNYYWSELLETWIILIHDKNAGTDLRPNQIMLDTDGKIRVFLNSKEDAFSKNKELFQAAILDIKANNFSVHVSASFPENFFPRAFYFNDKLICCARTNLEIEKITEEIQDCGKDAQFELSGEEDHGLGEKYQINFQWNIRVYFDYCAKIAFEFFSLLVGNEICLEKGFDELRSSVMGYRKMGAFEVIYIEEKDSRTFSSKLVPQGWISYVEIEDKLEIFPLTDDGDNLNHSIFIYELPNGLVCATVKLFNLHVAQIILGRRHPPLNFQSWRVEYNILTSKLTFHRSVNDKERAASLEKEAVNLLPKNSTITGFQNVTLTRQQ